MNLSFSTITFPSQSNALLNQIAILSIFNVATDCIPPRLHQRKQPAPWEHTIRLQSFSSTKQKETLPLFQLKKETKSLNDLSCATALTLLYSTHANTAATTIIIKHT